MQQKKKKMKDVPVTGTNDSCTISKCSMQKEGYFHDDFVSYFLSKSSRRSPLINRGYYVRAKAIEKALLTFLQEMAKRNKYTESQIISLGAGFDSTFFRLKHEKKMPPNCKYFEVDFHSVMKRKLQCIRKHNILKKMLHYEDHAIEENVNLVFSSKDYTLLGADLEDIPKLKEILLRAGVNFESPTFFLSECVLTYLKTKCCDDLIGWIAGTFPNSALVVYEQILPNDGFGLVMRKHFESIGSPLQSITTYSDIESQKMRYLTCGWKKCCVLGLNQLNFSLEESERLRSESLQPFDEYEEFHQKCSHYIVSCATQGLLENIPFYDNDHFDANLRLDPREGSIISCTTSRLKRFGHDAVLTGPDRAIVSGGFGEGCGRHERLGGVVRVNITSGLVEELQLHDRDKLLGRRIHHKLVLLEDGQILVTGGRGSPSQAFWQMLRLNTTTNTVEPFDTTGLEPGARWRHTATLVTVRGCQYVVVFGGKTSCDVLGDCLLLNVPSSSWMQLPSFPPRHSHSASCWGSKVIISGGLSALGRPLASVHSLDIDHACWEELPVLGLIPRYSHTSHIWNDSLFLIGGVHTLPANPPGIAIINLSSYVYREINLPGSCLGSPILLFKHSSVLLPNGQIVILGGGGNCFSFGTHLNGSVCSVWKSEAVDII